MIITTNILNKTPIKSLIYIFCKMIMCKNIYRSVSANVYLLQLLFLLQINFMAHYFSILIMQKKQETGLLIKKINAVLQK